MHSTNLYGVPLSTPKSEDVLMRTEVLASL